MKAIGIVAALAVLGVLALVLLAEPGNDVAPTEPTPAAEAEVEEPAQASELALPEEIGPVEEVEEVAMEEADEPTYPKTDKPTVLSRRMLADGRLEVKMLQPVFFGGAKKMMVRTIRARPTMIKRDMVRQRPTDDVRQEAPGRFGEDR